MSDCLRLFPTVFYLAPWEGAPGGGRSASVSRFWKEGGAMSEYDYLYEHARNFVATWPDDLAHEYATWFQHHYADAFEYASHSSASAEGKRRELLALEHESNERTWFERLCEDAGLRAMPAISAGEVRRGLYLFTVTGEPREVTKVRRTSKHTSVCYADGWSDSFANGKRISFVAERVA